MLINLTTNTKLLYQKEMVMLVTPYIKWKKLLSVNEKKILYTDSQISNKPLSAELALGNKT